MFADVKQFENSKFKLHFGGLEVVVMRKKTGLCIVYCFAYGNFLTILVI